MSHHITMNNITDYYVDLYTKYRKELDRLFMEELQEGHCKEYEELTMEEKLLVDIDMEYLKDETDIRYITSKPNKDLERCLSKLRKRDRENGERNGR